MRKRWWLTGLTVTIVAFGAAIALRHDVVRWTLETSARLASGYTVALGEQHIGFDRAVLLDVRVSRDGVPLLAATRIDVRYSLRDLLPGSAHRFGLVGVEVRDAKLTIVRFSDGTYNFIVPSAARALPHAPVPQQVSGVPIRFDLHMHGATLELREPQAYDGSAKQIRIVAVQRRRGDRHRAANALRGGRFVSRAEQPDALHARRHDRRGARLRDAPGTRCAIPVARAGQLLCRHAGRAHPQRARSQLRRAHLRTRRAARTLRRNTMRTCSSTSTAERSRSAALAAPVEAIHGRLQLVDNAFFLKHIHASLAGIPLHVSGGIYDLTGDLTGAAQLRLGIYGTGNLASLRRAFAFTRNEPISGVIEPRRPGRRTDR